MIIYNLVPMPNALNTLGPLISLIALIECTKQAQRPTLFVVSHNARYRSNEPASGALVAVCPLCK